MKKSYQYIIRSIIFGLFVLTGFSSCKKYLDEPPSKTTSLVVTTTDQLSALLNNYSQFYSEGNRTAIHSTDDYELPQSLYNARPATFSSMATIQFMLWDIPYLPDDTREGFWSGEYKKIFYANMALDYLDKVTGTDADKAAIKADAHLIRAYSYWELANTYCLPYTEANKNEAGLPIKLSTSFEEPFVRKPLSAVYSLIESDIAEALKPQSTLTDYTVDSSTGEITLEPLTRTVNADVQGTKLKSLLNSLKKYVKNVNTNPASVKNRCQKFVLYAVRNLAPVRSNRR